MSQTERLKYIDESICKNGIVKVQTVSSEFEVSLKTVKRDIQYLRDRLEAPVTYSPEKKGYVYTDEFSLFKFYDEKNLLFSSFLKKIIENNEFIPVISDKILKELSRNQPKAYMHLSECIIYDLPAHHFPDINIFIIFLRSLVDKKQCRIVYANLQNEVRDRFVEPLKIINYSGLWYLLCYCHNSGEMRTFALSRVVDIRLSDRDFSYKCDAKIINAYIRNSFGIIKKQPGDTVTEVKIRFSGRAYLIVKDQSFHPAQKVQLCDESPVKYAEFSFPVSDYREILGKVLQYGADAEVVAPDDFRELWRETIREMYRKIQ